MLFPKNIVSYLCLLPVVMGIDNNPKAIKLIRSTLRVFQQKQRQSVPI